MIRYVDYDPRRHKGGPICALEDGPEVDGVIPMILHEVTDSEERRAAVQVSWYYVVKIEDPDEAPPACAAWVSSLAVCCSCTRR